MVLSTRWAFTNGSKVFKGIKSRQIERRRIFPLPGIGSRVGVGRGADDEGAVSNVSVHAAAALKNVGAIGNARVYVATVAAATTVSNVGSIRVPVN